MGWLIPERGSNSHLAHLLSLALMVSPALILGLAAVQYRSMLILGGGFVVFTLSLLILRTRLVWRPPTTSLLIMLHVIALGWFWFATQNNNESLTRLIRGVFIMSAMSVFIVHDFALTGVEPRRLARKYTHEILMRKHWPRTVLEFGKIPSVRKLRNVVDHDPSLAFCLLDGRNTEVQIAGLMALQGRTYWRWEEAAYVLNLAKSATDPEVRALAIHAVANSNAAEVIRGIAEYLRDPSPIVRTAAVESLLANAEKRWGLIRGPIRDFFSDPSFAKEGALTGSAGLLPPIALCDLTSWVMEPPPLAERAMRTLIDHYAKVIEQESNPALPSELGLQIIEDSTPHALRIELAVLLRKYNLIPPDVLDRMTDADQPGPIRLMAAEILLNADPTDSSAIDVLRGIGRLSNRDMALVVARLLQTFQNLDFGVPLDGSELSPAAALELPKRVYRWATGRPTQCNVEETPFPIGDAIPARPVRSRPIAESDPGYRR